MKKYRKKKGTEVLAIQFNFDSDGFVYEKWGETQRCKPGDWIVASDDDTYTVDAESFARTYQEVGPGRFFKIAAVWARLATAAGTVPTKEGATRYEPGDYIVCNDAEQTDCYAVSADKFENSYEEVW